MSRISKEDSGACEAIRNYGFIKKMKEFAERSTIHGISYVSDPDLSPLDRLLWLLIFFAFFGLAVVSIKTSHLEWQNDQVISTMTFLKEPMTTFSPSITICSPGLHMDQIEMVLLSEFEKWKQGRKSNDSMENWYAHFMKEEFGINDENINIMDVISTMIHPEAFDSNIIRQNHLSCRQEAKQKNEQEQTAFPEGVSIKTLRR